LYDASVAHVDDCIAQVLGELDTLGVTDQTLIVLTSDHGEEFGEHAGIGHGRSLYGEVVRVPLIMVYPPRLEAGRRIRHLSEHLDLSPTILELADVDVPRTFRGTTVLDPAEHAFLEIGTWRGIAANGFKWVWNRDSGEQKLFALDDELDRTSLDDPATAQKLRAQLEPYLEVDARRDPKADAARVGQGWTDEEKERLRALGYAQ
jgi:arylsulfatase A-like enzyme